MKRYDPNDPMTWTDANAKALGKFAAVNRDDRVGTVTFHATCEEALAILYGKKGELWTWNEPDGWRWKREWGGGKMWVAGKVSREEVWNDIYRDSRVDDEKAFALLDLNERLKAVEEHVQRSFEWRSVSHDTPQIDFLEVNGRDLRPGDVVTATSGRGGRGEWESIPDAIVKRLLPTEVQYKNGSYDFLASKFRIRRRDPQKVEAPKPKPRIKLADAIRQCQDVVNEKRPDSTASICLWSRDDGAWIAWAEDAEGNGGPLKYGAADSEASGKTALSAVRRLMKRWMKVDGAHE